MSLPSIDGLLIQWGDRLFYPGNRRVTDPPARLRDPKRDADTIRLRIQATLRRAPQVMVKVTGGGRGMKAIAALGATSARTAGSGSRTSTGRRSRAGRRCASSATTGDTADR